MRSRSWLAVPVIGLALVPGQAFAYIDSGDQACGASSASWNAPKGANVSARLGEHAPIGAIITLLGEYYTHSMLSHGTGPDRWVSHTTAKQPGTWVNPFGDDHLNTDELAFGYPGPAQVNMGAAYTMLFGTDASQSVVYVEGNSKARRTADWLAHLPLCENVPEGICRLAVRSRKANDTFYLIARKQDGRSYRHSYGVYQYTNDREVPEGDDRSDPGWAQHCTTFIAWALALATGQVVSSATYPTGSVTMAQLTHALHSDVTQLCRNTGGFLASLFVDCEDLADQTVNCFTDVAQCDNDDERVWQSYAGPAVSISPDRMLGLVGHSDVHSPWAFRPAFPLQWNQPGTSYGCWF
jgi:hypothetical protein